MPNPDRKIDAKRGIGREIETGIVRVLANREAFRQQDL
jgi:hypothetical protein